MGLPIQHSPPSFAEQLTTTQSSAEKTEIVRQRIAAGETGVDFALADGTPVNLRRVDLSKMVVSQKVW